MVQKKLVVLEKEWFGITVICIGNKSVQQDTDWYTIYRKDIPWTVKDNFDKIAKEDLIEVTYNKNEQITHISIKECNSKMYHRIVKWIKAERTKQESAQKFKIIMDGIVCNKLSTGNFRNDEFISTSRSETDSEIGSDQIRLIFKKNAPPNGTCFIQEGEEWKTIKTIPKQIIYDIKINNKSNENGIKIKIIQKEEYDEFNNKILVNKKSIKYMAYYYHHHNKEKEEEEEDNQNNENKENRNNGNRGIKRSFNTMNNDRFLIRNDNGKNKIVTNTKTECMLKGSILDFIEIDKDALKCNDDRIYENKSCGIFEEIIKNDNKYQDIPKYFRKPYFLPFYEESPSVIYGNVDDAIQIKKYNEDKKGDNNGNMKQDAD